MTRIAIVDNNKCKPNKCSKECMKFCPPQSAGKQVIDIEDIGNNMKSAKISEVLCIGCNICVNKCPFDAIKIINLPSELNKNITFSYGDNKFRLYKLPAIKKNSICGIIGQNGCGKSTIIKLLSNQLKPTFDNNQISDKEIIQKFRGTSLQNYFSDLYNNKLKIIVKPQDIYNYLDNTKNVSDYIINDNLSTLYNKKINQLSGGELQQLIIYITINTPADVYIFDEPSNYLDIKQRINISHNIKGLLNNDKYVIVIDHDLAMLDYITDDIFIIYGESNAYGSSSICQSNLIGINNYLSGYIPNDNIRFKNYEYIFNNSSLELKEDRFKNDIMTFYKDDVIKYSNFELKINNGCFDINSSINIILGPNGTGKTTFIKWLSENCNLSVSIKKQSIDFKKTNLTVFEALNKTINNKLFDNTFISEIIKPLEIEKLYKQKISELSGGEAQKLSICICLGKPAQIYLIDEPSANLDIEKRLLITSIIKKYIINSNKCAFIVEHDIMMAVNFIKDIKSSVILCSSVEENNYVYSNIKSYSSWKEGINNFLNYMNITIRTDHTNGRPRINKSNSLLDKEQIKSNNYFN
jgi:ATP-binding cassette subfamily E protein 1